MSSGKQNSSKKKWKPIVIQVYLYLNCAAILKIMQRNFQIQDAEFRSI